MELCSIVNLKKCVMFLLKIVIIVINSILHVQITRKKVFVF